MANVAEIKTYDIANGKGIRTSIFFSGCEFACPNCFNSEIWSFDVGEPFTKELYETRIKSTINEHIAGLSVLGGESLHHRNIEDVAKLVLMFKLDFPDKDIWLWTGFRWEELMEEMSYSYKGYAVYLKTVLLNIDVLVDGRFIEEEKNLALPWAGSANQKVINVQESLKQNKIILYQ